MFRVKASLFASGAAESLRAWLTTALGLIGAWGWWGLAGIMALYTPVAVAALPVWPLSVTAGFFWGVGWGLAVAWVGSTVAAVVAFLVGRRLGRDMVLRRLGQRPILVAIDRAIGERGFEIVVLARLSPLLPYNVLNYAFSVTSVSWRTFALASLFGMLPVTAMYVTIGAAAESLAELLAGEHERSALVWPLLVVGAIASVLVVVVITRAARRILRDGVGR